MVFSIKHCSKGLCKKRKLRIITSWNLLLPHPATQFQLCSFPYRNKRSGYSVKSSNLNENPKWLPYVFLNLAKLVPSSKAQVDQDLFLSKLLRNRKTRPHSFAPYEALAPCGTSKQCDRVSAARTIWTFVLPCLLNSGPGRQDHGCGRFCSDSLCSPLCNSRVLFGTFCGLHRSEALGRLSFLTFFKGLEWKNVNEYALAR